MALPAAKGVIIVGGIAIAVGIALWEHEPFREWAQETWTKTSTAFQDFADGIDNGLRHKRKEMPFGAMRDFAERRGRRRRSGAEDDWRGKSRHEMRSTSRKRRDSGIAETADGAGRAERAGDVSVHEHGSGAGLRNRHEPHQEAPGLPPGALRSQEKAAGDSEESHNASSHTFPSHPTAGTPASRRTSAASSDIDIISAPPSVHTGSEPDDISNVDVYSDSGTETMSHISDLDRYSDAEGAIDAAEVSHDGDDVASVASSWSEVESVRSGDL